MIKPYNTGNPVPSYDPRDLDDNAEILDKLITGTELVVPDRKGIPRKSWAGIENAASGLPAIEAAERAETAAEAAEAARDAAQNAAGLFPDTAAGILKTDPGEYFFTPSKENAKFTILWLNNAGVAELVQVSPSAGAVQDAIGVAKSAAVGVAALQELIEASGPGAPGDEVRIVSVLAEDRVSILAYLSDKRLHAPSFDILSNDGKAIALKFKDGSIAFLSDETRTIIGHLHAEHSRTDGIRVVDSEHGIVADLTGVGLATKREIQPRPLDDLLVFSPVIATAADYESSIYVPGMLKRRELADKVQATITSTSTAESASGHILPISAAKYGAGATLSLRQPDEPDARLFMSLDLRNVPHQTLTPVKVLLIMDSIGNYQAGYWLKHYLEQMGFAPTFIGTTNGEGTTTSNGPLGECRPSWESGDFTYLETGMGKPVAAGGEAAYMALSKTAKLAYNPFIRLAVLGDPVDLVRNGYIFDMAFYLSRFGLESPDIIVNGMGTNDARDKNPSIIYETVYDNDRIMHSQTIAALPAAKILRFVPPTSRTTARDYLWSSSYCEIIRAFKNCAADLFPTKVAIAPVWAMVNVDGGYILPAAAPIRSDGFTVGTYSDQIHPQGATRVAIFKALAPFIGAQFLNII